MGIYIHVHNKSKYHVIQAHFQLAMKVIETEFPDWELLRSFSVFSLNNERKESNSNRYMALQTDELHLEMLARLAQAFGVDKDALVREFYDHFPLALRLYMEAKVSTQEAWRRAVERMQGSRASTRVRHPATALLPVLEQFHTFGSSTSGVEQGFAKRLRTITPQQGSASHQMEVDLCKVVTDVIPEEREEIANAAAAIWAKRLGEARASPKQSRLHKGIPFTKKRSANTESGWVQKKRRAVHDASKHTEVPAMADQVVDVDGWTLGHAEELHFQTQKQNKRLLHDEKSLLPHELTESVRGSLERCRLAQAKRDKERKAEARRRDLRSSGGSLTIAKGMKVYVDESVVDRVLPTSFSKLGLEQQSNRFGADLLLVVDPADVGRRTLAAAVLTGARLVTARLGAGPVIAFKPAVGTRRKIYCSVKLAEKQPALVSIIVGAAAQPGSKWKVIPNLLAFQDAKTRAINQKRPKDVVGIGTSKDVAKEALLLHYM